MYAICLYPIGKTRDITIKNDIFSIVLRNSPHPKTGVGISSDKTARKEIPHHQEDAYSRWYQKKIQANQSRKKIGSSSSCEQACGPVTFQLRQRDKDKFVP